MQNLWKTWLSRVRPGLFFALILTLMSVYFITYSSFFQSQDTTRIYDAATSLVQYGDMRRDETLWRDPPNDFNASEEYPLEVYDPNEPLMPIAVSFWLRIIYLIPNIGLVHGTWIFNILVATAICGVFFYYGRLLGYPDKVALIGALLLGLTTVLWIYSKTLFREPLVALFILLVAFLIEAWRKTGFLRGVFIVPIIIATLAGAVLTKNSSLVAIPALIFLILPDKVFNHTRLRIIWDSALFGLIFIVVGITFFEPIKTIVFDLLSQISPRFSGENAFVQDALFSYLFSIGGSIWGTSPVISLGIPGSIILIKQGHRRLVWAGILLLSGYAVGHALTTGQHWFGGVSYPPRFLIPILPFLMVLLLPTLDWLVNKSRSLTLWHGLAGIVIVYSFIIQVIGSLSLLLSYNALLPPQANGLHEWSGGLNNPLYVRWVLLPRAWSNVGFDTAWSRIDMPVFGWIFLIIALGSLVVIWQWKKQSRLRLLLPVLALGLGVTVGFELSTLYRQDTLYKADNQALFDMLAIVNSKAKTGEPLLIEANAAGTHERFIMNYGRSNIVRPIVIGLPPGEASSDEDRGCIRDWAVYEHEVVCLDIEYPPSMLDWYSIHAIDFLAAKHETIWFLANNSQFLPWSVRSVERYLNERFYLVQEYKTDDPTVRLLRYDTTNAPNRYEFRLPERQTSLLYGESIALSGFTLPLETAYQAGDVVPITLYWQPLSPLETDYVIAWFIVKTDFSIPPIQGVDSMPSGGFQPTSNWQMGEIIYDNRAIKLPDDIPVGEYNIWVLMYQPTPDGGERLPVTGGETIDGEIGVLPVTLMISAKN